MPEQSLSNGTGVRALEGVRVLDLSRVLAGPWCTQILGDFGADVVKVELPGMGDDTRAWGPPFLPADAANPDLRGESAYYVCCNRNKRSVAIDLAQPAGAELIRKLAVDADIVIENFRVGGLKKYGLDYESLRAVNPRLVYCSITGFGQDGPYAARSGYDFLAQAAGGLMSVTGEPGGTPVKAGIPVADLSTGMYATVSVLVALRHAERTGIGQYLDLSLLDTQISMLGNQALNWLIGGMVPGLMGNAHPSIVPYRTFQAADAIIVVGVGNDAQFRSLCEAIERPELAQDERFARNPSRVKHRAVLEAELQRTIGGRRADELIGRLSAAGVPAGPMNTIDKVFQDPFVEARHVVQRFEREDGVSIPTVAFPGKLSATPADYRREPPRLGQHTHEVLGQWLQMSEAELGQLESAGVIAGRKAA
jgi:crotonobetainyl-CoA:carnitine CoA-transferase CaiB-like acyl-CoA transferase